MLLGISRRHASLPPARHYMKSNHMNKRLLYIALVVLTSSGSGCMNTSSHGKTINAIQQPDVHATLGAGDVFDIRVFQEPDLSGMYRVDESGRIDYPLVGPVQVAGRLPNDVAAELRSRLRSFVKSPQISV